MLFQRETKNLLDVFNQLKLKNTRLFDHVIITENGKPKNILTVGVRERMEANSITTVLDNICDNTFAIIVEKPSIKDINQHCFTEDNLRLCGFDKIQNDLIKKHTNDWLAKGVEIIGAEGKKVFIDRNNEIRIANISIAHKMPEKDYLLKLDVIKKMAAEDKLYHLAEKIINKCFGMDHDSMDEIIKQINSMIEYQDDTDIQAIFNSLFNRVNYLAKRLSANDKANIKNHILEDITQNIFNHLDELSTLPEKLQKHIDHLTENVNIIETFIDDNPEYITYIEANVPLDEIVGEYPSLTQQDFQAYKEFQENHNFSTIIDKMSNDLKVDINSRILDEIFTKTCCGLRLYSELLANKKENLIVMFSQPHYDLLNKFIEKTCQML